MERSKLIEIARKKAYPSHVKIAFHNTVEGFIRSYYKYHGVTLNEKTVEVGDERYGLPSVIKGISTCIEKLKSEHMAIFSDVPNQTLYLWADTESDTGELHRRIGEELYHLTGESEIALSKKPKEATAEEWEQIIEEKGIQGYLAGAIALKAFTIFSLLLGHFLDRRDQEEVTEVEEMFSSLSAIGGSEFGTNTAKWVKDNLPNFGKPTSHFLVKRFKESLITTEKETVGSN